MPAAMAGEVLSNIFKHLPSHPCNAFSIYHPKVKSCWSTLISRAASSDGTLAMHEKLLCCRVWVLCADKLCTEQGQRLL